MIIQKTHRNSFNFVFFFVDSGKKLCCLIWILNRLQAISKQNNLFIKKNKIGIFK